MVQRYQFFVQVDEELLQSLFEWESWRDGYVNFVDAYWLPESGGSRSLPITRRCRGTQMMRMK